MTDDRVAGAVRRVREMLRAGRVDAGAAVAVLRAVVESVGDDVDAVEKAVVEIAKGEDGIAGTADDLIPAATLDTLRSLLHNGTVRAVAAWVAELASPARWKRWCCASG